MDWEITSIDESIYDHIDPSEYEDIYSFKIESKNARRFRELYHDGLDIVNNGLVLSKEEGEKIKEIAKEALGLLVDPAQDISRMCFLKLGR
ncbi:hypothetical protein [Brevibacillus porteri]|uniref:hypothetical protein n=1 Tax=Brevibacillus porteri TaxID=2126350 RepID=UPI003632AB47